MFDNFNSPAIERSTGLVNVNIRPLMKNVYLWMTIALVISGSIAMFLATQMEAAFAENARNALTSGIFSTISAIAIPAFIAQIAISFGLSLFIQRIPPAVAVGLFLLYAVITGVVLSAIIFGTIAEPQVNPRTGEITVVAQWAIVAQAFFTTAALFGVMTVVGYTTKVDLDKFSTFFMMGLLGVFIAGIVNIFLGSGLLSMIISIAAVILFTGITAWDTQKIKQWAESGAIQEGTADFTRYSIIGAFMLYLDFINLFVHLLRLFAAARD
jgi:uncharacterized protein